MLENGACPGMAIVGTYPTPSLCQVPVTAPAQLSLDSRRKSLTREKPSPAVGWRELNCSAVGTPSRDSSGCHIVAPDQNPDLSVPKPNSIQRNVKDAPVVMCMTDKLGG